MSKPAYPATLNSGNSAVTGLAAFWLANEGAGTTLHDASGNGHDLTAHGGVTWGAGPDLVLDGSSGYAEVPSRLLTGGNFSLFARVRPATTSLGGHLRLILAQGNIVDGTYIGLLFNDGGTVGAQAGGPAGAFNSTAQLAAGSWANVVLVYAAGTVTLYVGGAAVASGADAANYTGDRFDLGISPSGSGARCFPGEVDAAGVWSRALTADEISYLEVDPYLQTVLAAATSYTVTGPASCVASQSARFTIAPNGFYTGTVTLALSGLLSGTRAVSFTGGFLPQSVSVTPPTTGTVTLTPAAAPALGADPAPLTLTAVAGTPRFDAFDRPDTTAGLGTPSDGGSAWVQVAGTFGIAAHRAYSLGGPHDVTYLDTNLPNARITGVVSTLSSNAVLVARYTDAANYVAVVVQQPNRVGLYNWANNSWVLLREYVGRISSGDTYQLVCVDDQMEVLQNGVVRVGPVTNNFNQAATRHGISEVGDGRTQYSSFAVDPPAGPAASYTVTGPARVPVGLPSDRFVVTPVGGSYAGTVTIALAGGGLSGSVTLTFPGGFTDPQSFRITAPAAGTVTLTPSASPALGADPAPLAAAAVVVGDRTDGFDRPDTTAGLGTPSDGGPPWSALAGDWGISAGRAYCVSGSPGAVCVLPARSADVLARLTLADRPPGVFSTGLALRVADPANFFYCAWNAFGVYLYRVQAGTPTLLGTQNYQTVTPLYLPAAGDAVAVRCAGPNWTVYLNGVSAFTATDSFNQTAAQFGLYADLDPKGRLDSFALRAPTTAVALSLAGPGSLARGAGSAAFTVALAGGTTVPAPVTVTPYDGGAGGSFSPAAVTLAANTPGAAATFTYTAARSGAVAVNVANDGGLFGPAALNYTVTAPASAYTLAAPAAGRCVAGNPSGNFTVALKPGESVPAPVTVTPADGGAGGSFSPAAVTLAANTPGAAATFAYTPPATAGTHTITAANDRALIDPAGVSFAGVAAATSYTLAGPAAGDCGRAWQFQLPVPPDFTHQTLPNTFTVALPPDRSLVTPVTVTPHDDAHGEFLPATVTLARDRPSATVDYVSHDWGARAVTAAAGGALADPAPHAFLARVQAGSSGTLGFLIPPHGGTGTGSCQGLDLGGYNFFGPARGNPGNTDPWWDEMGRNVAADPVHPQSNTLVKTLCRGADPTTVPTYFLFGGSGYYAITGSDSRVGFPTNVATGDTPEAPIATAIYPTPDCPLTTSGPLWNTVSSENWIADAFSVLGQPTAIDHYDGNDRHTPVFVRDEATGAITKLREYQTPWTSDSGATWSVVSGLQLDLTTGQAHLDGTPSTDAAGLPLGPLLIRYPDYPGDVLGHALRADIQATKARYVWPARAAAGYNIPDAWVYVTADAPAGATSLTIAAAGAPSPADRFLLAGDSLEFASGAVARITADVPFAATSVAVAPLAAAVPAGDCAFTENYFVMGQRWRVKASWYDAHVGALTPAARFVFTALRDHGVLIADNVGGGFGAGLQICGNTDSRWQNAETDALYNALPTAAYEVVKPRDRCVITAPAVVPAGVPATVTATHPIAGETRFALLAQFQWANSWDAVNFEPVWQYSGFSPGAVTFSDGVPGPLSTRWTPPAPGRYLIRARTDNGGGDFITPPTPPILVTAVAAGHATAYSVTGPASGTVGVASGPFTVTPNDLYTGTVTPSDGGAGGTFNPTSLSWVGAADPRTFTYTAPSAGVRSIAATSSPALTDPSALSYTASVPAATAYSFTGPASGAAGAASGPFTVTPNGPYSGAVAVAVAGGGLGTTVTLTWAGTSGPQTFTITPPAAGTVTLTPTASPALGTNPAPLAYAATSAGGGGTPPPTRPLPVSRGGHPWRRWL